MLFLTRKTGQAVIINDSIEVNVIEIMGKTVKLGFKFPPTETVLRQELYERIKKETEMAAQAVSQIQDINPADLLEKTLPLESSVNKILNECTSHLPKEQKNQTTHDHITPQTDDPAVSNA